MCLIEGANLKSESTASRPKMRAPITILLYFSPFSGLTSAISDDIIQAYNTELLVVPTTHFESLVRLRDSGFNPRVIYDVGSSLLHWARAAQEVWPNSRIIAFEAMTSVNMLYEELDMEYHLGVLCDIDGREVDFYESDRVLLSTGQSYYREIGSPGSEPIYKEENSKHQTCRTLQSVVEERGFPLPDLIKLDVQGAELDIIRGSEELIRSAEFLIAEMQYYEYNQGAPNLTTVLPYIESVGFLCVAPAFSLNGPDADYGFKRIHDWELSLQPRSTAAWKPSPLRTYCRYGVPLLRLQVVGPRGVLRLKADRAEGLIHDGTFYLSNELDLTRPWTLLAHDAPLFLVPYSLFALRREGEHGVKRVFLERVLQRVGAAPDYSLALYSNYSSFLFAAFTWAAHYAESPGVNYSTYAPIPFDIPLALSVGGMDMAGIKADELMRATKDAMQSALAGHGPGHRLPRFFLSQSENDLTFTAHRERFERPENMKLHPWPQQPCRTSKGRVDSGSEPTTADLTSGGRIGSHIHWGEQKEKTKGSLKILFFIEEFPSQPELDLDRLYDQVGHSDSSYVLLETVVHLAALGHEIHIVSSQQTRPYFTSQGVHLHPIEDIATGGPTSFVENINWDWYIPSYLFQQDTHQGILSKLDAKRTNILLWLQVPSGDMYEDFTDNFGSFRVYVQSFSEWHYQLVHAEWNLFHGGWVVGNGVSTNLYESAAVENGIHEATQIVNSVEQTVEGDINADGGNAVGKKANRAERWVILPPFDRGGELSWKVFDKVKESRTKRTQKLPVWWPSEKYDTSNITISHGIGANNTATLGYNRPSAEFVDTMELHIVSSILDDPESIKQSVGVSDGRVGPTNIVFHPPMSKRDVSKLLKTVDYLVYPIVLPDGQLGYDTFSTTILEALAAGVTVFTWDLPSVRSLFGNHISYIRPPKSADYDPYTGDFYGQRNVNMLSDSAVALIAREVLQQSLDISAEALRRTVARQWALEQSWKRRAFEMSTYLNHYVTVAAAASSNIPW